MSEHPTRADLDRILADPHDRRFSELSDRAAFVYVTGCYPSHLRSQTNRLLTLMLDGRGAPGSQLRIDADIAIRLRLDQHPMVTKTLWHVRDGYAIRASRGPNARKPYGKIHVFKGPDQRVIQIDGSVKDGWD